MQRRTPVANSSREGRVTTFECAGGAARPWGSARDLREASASLPAGAYTTLRTYGGRNVVRLERHLGRLQESATALGYLAELDEGLVRRALAGALRSTGHTESRLRLSFAPPRLFVSVEPFQALPASFYRDGVECATVQVRRERPHSKDTRFIAEAFGAYRSLREGVHEGLIVGDDGAILEGLTSNFFALVAGTLRTEERRALAGVTRSLVLDAALGLVPVLKEAVRADEVPAVAECFLTSASRGILPVVAIDGRRIGDGIPGPLTRELMRRFDDLVAREAEGL